MPVRMPSPQDLRDAGRRFGFDVNDEEVDGFLAVYPRDAAGLPAP